MTLRAFLRLLRRWIVVIIVGVVVAIGAAVAAYMVTPPTYSVKAQYLFLPAAVDDKGAPANPFLMVGNGIGILLDSVSTSMMDGETVRGFVGDSKQLEYTVVRDGSVSAPLILITVTDSDKASAFDVLDRVGTETLDRSLSLQEAAGAPKSALVEGTQLTRSVKAEVDHKDGLRNGILAALGVIVLVLLIVVIGDRRRSKKDLTAILDESAASAPVHADEPVDLEDPAEELFPRTPAP
ncbi:hypothetical protein [Microbacterium sp. NPDC057650]|uniref:hypothetical protein n=1 Tax=unclassified Microbacterium TaxID=2609290 RepID=UPI00366F16AE